MAMTQTNNKFTEFIELALPEQAVIFGEKLKSEGFTAVRRFLDDFRGYLRTFTDSQIGTAHYLVEQGRRALPEPGRVSPSFSDIWIEFGDIASYKQEVFEQIPEHRRDGEWQVLLDNPFTNGNIAVYPVLTFMEAAYMYAYFRAGLEKNEFIRLQKIDTVITNSGIDRS